MSEWTLFYIALLVFVVGFVPFYKLFKSIRFFRVLKLYLPAFYLLIILFAVVSHLLFPAQIVGEGKTKFSVGQTIGIITSLPGIFAFQFAETLGLGFLFENINNIRYGLPILIGINFVIYWIINLIFAYLFILLKRLPLLFKSAIKKSG